MDISKQIVGGKQGLSLQQKQFCEEYVRTGNARQSALKAGYSESVANSTAGQMAKSPRLKAYMDHLMDAYQQVEGASIEEIQAFWHSIIKSPIAKDQDKLKASELMAKSIGAFVDRTDTTINSGQPIEIVFHVPGKTDS